MIEQPSDGLPVRADVRDAVTGRFLPGGPGGPGRPKGSRRKPINVVAAELADLTGMSVDTMLQQVLGGLVRAASKGDAAAGRIVLDRLTHSGDGPPGCTIDDSGPPVPQGRAMSEYLRRLAATYAEDAPLSRQMAQQDGGDPEAAETRELTRTVWNGLARHVERVEDAKDAERVGDAAELDRLLS